MSIVSYKVNNLFTDFAKLERAVGRESAQALRRVGGQIRTRLKRQVRRRKNASTPPNSPHAHSPGNTGFRRVEFKLESNYRLVVGAVKYGPQLQDAPVPAIHEAGLQVVARREQDVPIKFIRRGGRVIQTVRGRPINVPLPPGIRENRGLLVDVNTGRYLNKAQGIALRRQQNMLAKRQAQRIGRVRKYPKRPVAGPVLARALADQVIPSQFRNIVRSL